jgi:peptidyl-prolyl cis-trans isomerase D
MLSAFRSLSKSKFGTFIVASFFILILVGFAVSDLSNFGSGNIGFGMGGSTLAEVGDEKVTDREMSDAMQRRLQEVRQQNPEADYPAILGDYDRVLDALTTAKALNAFAAKFGFHLSKRLIDAEIAQIPQTRGLNGQFNEQSYRAFLAQQRLTDAQVRQVISAGLLQRLLIAPTAGNPRIPVGMATPYASMMLEAREGEAAAIPVDVFKAGLNPSDRDLQGYYSANRARYAVPEQRVIRYARIGPDQLASVTASDQEITAYYNANQATYGAKQTRSLTQAVVPNQAAANAIAARAKGGATLAAAAGADAAVSSVKDQSRQVYASAAGDAVAAAAFSAPSGAVVGPVRSDFGWVVVKVDSVNNVGGRPLAQVRSEIAAKLTADKRAQALEQLVTAVQDSIDDGSNFAEAAAQAKATPATTPLVTAAGQSRTDPGYRVPPELAPVIKAGFEIAPNDPSEIITLPNDQGYALVSPAQVVAAAPAPFADVRGQVRTDWINGEARKRAQAAASSIAAKAGRGVALAQAVREAGVSLPAIRPLAARRLQIATATSPVPPPILTLFALGQGKSKMVADPRNATFFVVKVNKVVPGNALLQPTLIGQMQTELQQSAMQDYAEQFIAAVRAEMNVKRNPKAIADQKRRMASGSGT